MVMLNPFLDTVAIPLFITFMLIVLGILKAFGKTINKILLILGLITLTIPIFIMFSVENSNKNNLTLSRPYFDVAIFTLSLSFVIVMMGLLKTFGNTTNAFLKLAGFLSILVPIIFTNLGLRQINYLGEELVFIYAYIIIPIGMILTLTYALVNIEFFKLLFPFIREIEQYLKEEILETKEKS